MATRVLIELKTGNDAFVDCEGIETARILRGLCDLLEHMNGPELNKCFDEDGYRLRDLNGNTVGRAYFEAY